MRTQKVKRWMDLGEVRTRRQKDLRARNNDELIEKLMELGEKVV